MGYDFTFLRFKNKPNSFPFSPDKEFNFLEEIKEVLSPKEIEIIGVGVKLNA